MTANRGQMSVRKIILLLAPAILPAIGSPAAPVSGPDSYAGPGPEPPSHRVPGSGLEPLAFAEDRYVYRQVHMGMQVRIVLYAAEEYEARQAAGAAFAEIARLDAVFSDYRNDSELSRLVDRAGQAPVPVTQELYEVLGRGQHLARQTGGAFDITAGALTRLWRAAIRDGKVPDEAARRAAMAASGSDWLRLDGRSQTAQVTGAGVRLDLGGIAKGYVIDRALRTLGVHGVTRALVQAGGDIVVGAAPGGEVGWRLTIPYAACEVVVADAAISTSGDTEQFVEVEGKRYSHTVDPRSGFGLTQRRIATVVATDGIAADSLATAITILEDKEVEALLHLYPGARALVGHLRPLGGSSEPKLYNLQIYEEPATSHVPNAPGVFAACRRQARR